MDLAWTWAAALGLSFPLLAAGSHQDDLLFDELGKRWLARNEVQSPSDWNALLRERFAHLEVGAFDVYLPASGLKDAKALKEAGAAVQALFDVQRGWAGWVGATGLGKKDLDAVAKWLKGWSPKGVAEMGAPGADLLDLTRADAGLRALLRGYAVEQRSGLPLGSAHEIRGVALVVFPRRGEFVEFTCLAGALDARLKPTAWSGSLTTWLEYQADETRFVTLEYGSESVRDIDRGVSVAEHNPAALGQLVAQVATRGLLARLVPGLDPALSSGIANALVIDLYGELDTRIDGDVRARSSQGTSVFVPGGNPEGGILPPTSAENRWRGTKGKDHFVGILAQVQKQSGKKARTRPERLARFELQSFDGARKECVSGPFLGPKAVRPSPDLLPDYLEFVRGYGVAFLHWLRLEGAGKDSEARFAAFLRALESGATAEELPTVMAEIYGQPLSAASLEELFAHPTLEGRFLAWIAK